MPTGGATGRATGGPFFDEKPLGDFVATPPLEEKPFGAFVEEPALVCEPFGALVERPIFAALIDAPALVVFETFEALGNLDVLVDAPALVVFGTFDVLGNLDALIDLTSDPLAVFPDTDCKTLRSARSTARSWFRRRLPRGPSCSLLCCSVALTIPSHSRHTHTSNE